MAVAVAGWGALRPAAAAAAADGVPQNVKYGGKKRFGEEIAKMAGKRMLLLGGKRKAITPRHHRHPALGKNPFCNFCLFWSQKYKKG